MRSCQSRVNVSEAMPTKPPKGPVTLLSQDAETLKTGSVRLATVSATLREPSVPAPGLISGPGSTGGQDPAPDQAQRSARTPGPILRRLKLSRVPEGEAEARGVRLSGSRAEAIDTAGGQTDTVTEAKAVQADTLEKTLSARKKQSWTSGSSMFKLSLTALFRMKQWKSKTKLVGKTKEDMEIEDVSDAESDLGHDWTPPPLEHVMYHDPTSPEAASDPAGEPPTQPALFSLPLRQHALLGSVCSHWRALEPQSPLYIGWLLLVAVVFLYNCWMVPYRAFFLYGRQEFYWPWLVADYLGDLVNLLDVFGMKPRLSYVSVQDGTWVTAHAQTARHYAATAMCWMDILAVVPVDLLYIVYGSNSLFRVNRMFKIHTYWEFFGRLTAVTAFPNVTRVSCTLFYMLFLIHVNSCAYYMASLLQGFGANEWTYNNEGNAYARCVFFATKTAMSVGRNPKPTHVGEHVFMAVSWLLGVFVFATLLGQIHDIVEMADRSQTEFRESLDKVMLLLKNKGVPQETRQRVKLWLTYTHTEDSTPTEHRYLRWLPMKLRTDVAMRVHYSTLGRVRLFRGCDVTFLRDAVLRLQPVVLLPGDFVFRQGDIGRDMFIVSTGFVEVLGAPERPGAVRTRLGVGSVFGENSILVPHCRRCVDVRSPGFTTLFRLSREQFWSLARRYPDVEQTIARRTRRRMARSAQRRRWGLGTVAGPLCQLTRAESEDTD